MAVRYDEGEWCRHSKDNHFCEVGYLKQSKILCSVCHNTRVIISFLTKSPSWLAITMVCDMTIVHHLHESRSDFRIADPY